MRELATTITLMAMALATLKPCFGPDFGTRAGKARGGVQHR
jgi:hypothetical protein